MWSWVLAVIGVTGIFLVGRKTIWGWLVLCVNECLWIAYGLITKQYGFGLKMMQWHMLKALMQ
jgi:hypothetical protein